MVIDTSVIVAILVGEDDRRTLLEKMSMHPRLLLSAASLVETGAVLMGHRAGDREYGLDGFLERAGINVIAVDYGQALLAREAYRRFGKGRHSAKLNLGDCFSYALAISTGEPLLCKGEDFSKTDVRIA